MGAGEPGRHPAEALLAELPGVRDACVREKATPEGGTQLVAYFVPDLPDEAEPEAAELASTQVSHWTRVFDVTYRQAGPVADATTNLAGWNSSYTGHPIPASAMQEWVDQTVDRILALRPQRVLEIGCGTGLLLFRVAPHCEHYMGTDVSPVVLEKLAGLLAAAPANLPPVELQQREAARFEGLAPGSFDTVVINSVIQLFPNVNYLLRVLEGAVAVTRPGGAIFLGDVRNLPLLSAFCLSVELERAPDDLPVLRLWHAVQQRLAQESELAVDPAFFTALRRRLPRISGVEIRPKRGHHVTEMTMFRYDMVLRVEGQPESAAGAVPQLDWAPGRDTLAGLVRQLSERPPEALRVRGIPNLRVHRYVEALRAIRSGLRPATAGELRHLQGPEAVDPEALWALGETLPYVADVRLSAVDGGREGAVDLLLRRHRAPGDAAGDGAAAMDWPAAVPDGQLPWPAYTNRPLQGLYARRLVPRLRAALRERLPADQCPAQFVALDALPLDPDGRVNADDLPLPALPGVRA